MKTSCSALLLVAVFALVALSGCSSNSDGSSSGGQSGTPLACNDPVGHICWAFESVDDDERQNEVFCKNENVIPSCPTESLRATCNYSNWTGNNEIYWYTTASADDDQMKQSCDMSSGTLTMD